MLPPKNNPELVKHYQYVSKPFTVLLLILSLKAYDQYCSQPWLYWEWGWGEKQVCNIFFFFCWMTAYLFQQLSFCLLCFCLYFLLHRPSVTHSGLLLAGSHCRLAWVERETDKKSINMVKRRAYHWWARRKIIVMSTASFQWLGVWVVWEFATGKPREHGDFWMQDKQKFH